MNGLSPSCDSGTASNAAVSGSAAGPSTRSEGLFDSFRSSSAQIAPGASHARFPGSVTTTSARESGSTSMRQRTLLGAASRSASRTRPPVTSNAWSRSLAT